MPRFYILTSITLILLASCGPQATALPTQPPTATTQPTITPSPADTLMLTLEPWMVSLPDGIVSVEIEDGNIFGLDAHGEQIMQFNQMNGEWVEVEKGKVIVGFSEEINAAIDEMTKEETPLIPLHYTDGTEVENGEILSVESEGVFNMMAVKYVGQLDMHPFNSNFDPGTVTLLVFETAREDGTPMFFSVGIRDWSEKSISTKPVAIMKDGVERNFSETEWDIYHLNGHDRFEYLMRRFISMQPGQQVVITLVKPSGVDEQAQAAEEFFAALKGEDVDGVSSIEKSYWDFGSIILPDNGDRP